MKFYFTVIAFFISLFSFGQFYPVFLDGYFDEWNQSTNPYSDEAGDGNTIDLLSMKLLNDSERLYIYLKMYETINLNTDNSLILLIDTDNNSSTGYQKNGIGAELKWSFSRRKGTFYQSGNETTVWHSDLGFVALPTVSGSEFEISFLRYISINGNSLFPSNQIKINIFCDEPNGDMLPTNGTTANYTFDNTGTATFQEVSLNKTQEQFLRLMTFNTLYDGILDESKQPSFKRIIQAVNPDILTLNECWDSETTQILNLLNEWLPVQVGQWYASKLMDGNITASKYPIVNNYNVLSGQRMAASLIDLPNEKYPSDLAIVNCHLKCCNEEGDNQTRQYEIDGLIAFILKMKNGFSGFEVAQNTPFVFMGDFNLVGDKQQLHTLIHGDIQNTGFFGEGGFPDWNQQPLGEVVSTGTNNNMAYTWRDDSGSYWPGRLDYIFYTQTGLKKEKSFVLETEKMSEQALVNYNLRSNDSQTASDHFPHVADFSVLEYNSIKNEISTDCTIYPNPNKGTFILNYSEPILNPNILIYDISGQNTLIFTLNYLNNQQMEISGLKQGIYIIKVITDKKNIIQPCIVQP